MIVFLSNQKENCQYDRSPFKFKGKLSIWSYSIHIERKTVDMILVLSNWKENCQYDHIPVIGRKTDNMIVFLSNWKKNCHYDRFPFKLKGILPIYNNRISGKLKRKLSLWSYPVKLKGKLSIRSYSLNIERN